MERRAFLKIFKTYEVTLDFVEMGYPSYQKTFIVEGAVCALQARTWAYHREFGKGSLSDWQYYIGMFTAKRIIWKR